MYKRKLAKSGRAAKPKIAKKMKFENVDKELEKLEQKEKDKRDDDEGSEKAANESDDDEVENVS